MNDDDRRRGPSIGNVLAGIFLVLLALCLIFAGGGCTLMLVPELFRSSSGAMLPFLVISLAILGGGLAAMWFGVRLIAGKYD